MKAIDRYKDLLDAIREHCSDANGNLDSVGRLQKEVADEALDVVGPDGSEEDFEWQHSELADSAMIEY